MNEIIICVGISGSGKSTWTTNFIKENKRIIRCNRDSIRFLLNGTLEGYYQKSNMNEIEMFINKIEEDIVNSSLHNNYNIIIDNTNLKQSYINKWIEISQDHNCYHKLKFKLFDISLEDSKRRVAFRDNYWKQVDVYTREIDENKIDYINKQYKDYQLIKDWIIKNYSTKII